MLKSNKAYSRSKKIMAEIVLLFVATISIIASVATFATAMGTYLTNVYSIVNTTCPQRKQVKESKPFTCFPTQTGKV